jgi:cardiolipin synthase
MAAGVDTRRRADTLSRESQPITGDRFRRVSKYLSAITDAQVHDTRISLLRNGEEFYPTELQASREAKRTSNLEAYGFLEGEVSQEFLSVLTDRARSGVEVRMVVDAIGSGKHAPVTSTNSGRPAWYHPVDSRNWPYLNHRTHRKLLVVDGTIGFIGGAGFADHWLRSTGRCPRWRDTVLRVEGRCVAGLNAVFA